MVEGESLEDHVSMFKEIVTDLETLEVKYNEEDLTLILLCLLSESYAPFRDTILYSRDTLTIENVYDALHSKEKMKHLVGATSRDGKALVSQGDRRRGRLRVRISNVTCYYCKRKGHIRKDCDMLQTKGDLAINRKVQTLNSDETNVVENCSDGKEVILIVVSDVESWPDEEYILDLACSHHVFQ